MTANSIRLTSLNLWNGCKRYCWGIDREIRHKRDWHKIIRSCGYVWYTYRAILWTRAMLGLMYCLWDRIGMINKGMRGCSIITMTIMTIKTRCECSPIADNWWNIVDWLIVIKAIKHKMDN